MASNQNIFLGVVTETGHDHKPPQTSTNDHKHQNDHKLPVNDHKLPANDHKPTANDRKALANNHKRPNRCFPNSNYLIFLSIGNEAELGKCKWSTFNFTM